MTENNKDGQPRYKEQPWWVQLFVALYAMFWLTMIFVAGLNSRIWADLILTVSVWPLL